MRSLRPDVSTASRRITKRPSFFSATLSASSSAPNSRSSKPPAASNADRVQNTKQPAARRVHRIAAVIQGINTRAYSGTSPSKRTVAPPPIAPSATAASAARSTSSLISVSASTNTSISPLDARAPEFRVAAICRCCTDTTRAPDSAAICAVRSVDASSATTISYSIAHACCGGVDRPSTSRPATALRCARERQRRQHSVSSIDHRSRFRRPASADAATNSV